MAYADDKRIRELIDRDSLQLSDFMPLDRAGLIAARKFTVQDLVDLANGNIAWPGVYSGSTNPDNALGEDGSTYYKYVAGTSFGVWYKQSGSWSELFNFTFGSQTLSVTLDSNGEYDFTGVIAKAFPVVTIYDSSGGVSTYAYNNTTKKVTNGVPGEAIKLTYA